MTMLQHITVVVPSVGGEALVGVLLVLLGIERSDAAIIFFLL
jgi:hypothetical protein